MPYIFSLQLLAKYGLVHKASPGLYDYSPLGMRVRDKIERLVVQSMDGIEAQRINMSTLQPTHFFRKSGEGEYV